MTILEPSPRAAVQRSAVTVLTDGDVPDLQRLVQADPITNAVIASRLGSARSLRPFSFGATIFGVRSQTARGAILDSAAMSGGNLIPVGGDETSWTMLAAAIAARPRICTSVVGPANAVVTMWPILERRWGAPRAFRHEQPLLMLDRRPGVASDPLVRRVVPEDLTPYMAASAAMFLDELGVSPYTAPGVDAYRVRIAELIAAGHAFVRFDERGQVVFKADLAVVSPQTCQLQGVWVRPDLRGRGIATAAMATVLRHALILAPTVSLYVNDFNTSARRLYAKLGMRHHATLATVLL